MNIASTSGSSIGQPLHLEDPGIVTGHQVEGDDWHSDDHLALGILAKGDGATVAQHRHIGVARYRRQAQRQAVILWPVEHYGVHICLPTICFLSGVPVRERKMHSPMCCFLGYSDQITLFFFLNRIFY